MSWTLTSCRLPLMPQLRKYDCHLGSASHVLDADPFEWSMYILHPGEEVRRRHAVLRQDRAIGASSNRCRERLDAHQAARLQREIDRMHIPLQPVAHIAILASLGAG